MLNIILAWWYEFHLVHNNKVFVEVFILNAYLYSALRFVILSVEKCRHYVNRSVMSWFCPISQILAFQTSNCSFCWSISHIIAELPQKAIADWKLVHYCKNGFPWICFTAELAPLQPLSSLFIVCHWKIHKLISLQQRWSLFCSAESSPAG